MLWLIVFARLSVDCSFFVCVCTRSGTWGKSQSFLPEISVATSQTESTGPHRKRVSTPNTSFSFVAGCVFGGVGGVGVSGAGCWCY